MTSRFAAALGWGLWGVALTAGGLAAAEPPLADATLELVNRERAERGVVPLVPSDALRRAAAAKVTMLADEARLIPSSRPAHITAIARLDDLQQRLRSAGFEVRQAKAHVVVAEGALTAGDLIEREPALRRDLLDPELRELGLEVAREGRLEIVVAIIARSKEVDFVELTAPLADRDATREELLRLTNEARREARRPELRVDACLERTAQEYADRMLAEGFYGHHSPEGQDVGHRVRAAGCGRRALGENLARGQTGSRRVIDGWMDSPGHRENLLNPDYRLVGFGVALGRRDAEYWILWVQVLGGD